MIIDLIAGARPNFMKVAALFVRAGEFPSLDLRLVHTGQHYDAVMSDVFLRELALPAPSRHLGVGSGSHADQTAGIMKGYERWVGESRPDLCVVVGDVNSTLACALVSAKIGIRVAHVEAGLRSFDRTMPEEINRVLTDGVSDLMFASEPSGVENLKREGRPESGIHLVGNTMVDTLFRMRPRAESLSACRRFGAEPKGYAYLTLHRPSNVDDAAALREVCDQVVWLGERMPVIFPVHPRTRRRLEESGLSARLSGPRLHLIEPVGYLESLSMVIDARLVVTDSGGLQEETTALGVPCLTLRENTERPITVAKGTNTLIGRNWPLFQTCVKQIGEGSYPHKRSQIPYWDGNAGRRILAICERPKEKAG
jgi:UDP-N-acetylglucosamine 2-epimerase (non-hydrolysing)